MKVLVAAVHGRSRRVGVDRFEADSEAADLLRVVLLGRALDPADPAHVGLSERTAVVPDLEPIGMEVESHPGRVRVLSVLQELQQELGVVGVEVDQKPP